MTTEDPEQDSICSSESLSILDLYSFNEDSDAGSDSSFDFELDSPQSDIDSLGGKSGSDWNIDIVDNEDAEAEVPEQGSCRISAGIM